MKAWPSRTNLEEKKLETKEGQRKKERRKKEEKERKERYWSRKAEYSSCPAVSKISSKRVL